MRVWLRRESTELYIQFENISQGNASTSKNGEKLPGTDTEKSISMPAERPVLQQSVSSATASATIMTYEEAENPEEFFVPYLWSSVVMMFTLFTCRLASLMLSVSTFIDPVGSRIIVEP